MSDSLGSLNVAELIAALPQRLHEAYAPFVQSMPEHPAFLEGSDVWSYRRFSDAVDAVAADLESLGVRGGDRVMIVSENSVAAGAFVLAASKLDAWAIVVNPRLSSREIDQIYEHSGARRRFFMAAVSDEASSHAQRCEAARRTIGPFEEIAVAGLDEAAMAEPVRADSASQVAALIYTSGTTGAPKGVMLSHRNLLFAAKISGDLRAYTPADCAYGMLPMSHIVGLSIGLVGTLMFGATILMVPKYDPAHLVEAMANGEITVLTGVPASYQRLLAHKSVAGLTRLEKGRLRLLGVAGAPLDLTLKTRVEDEFGLPLYNGFGITECSPTISIAREGLECADESVGAPIPGVEVRIVDTTGAPAKDGEIGELHVRGPNVMLGYYRAPELTAQAVDSDGWFASGDLARFQNGRLYIVGRLKEMIIRSGFNVYPAEIEAVINEHPAVLQSAVVGRAVSGNEEVVAFVQIVPGKSASAEELKAFIDPLLTPYKRPTEIRILDAFPAGSTGKILKHLLKAQASAV